MRRSVEAVAPGKVILFGEHAINRGQPAIAAAVGLYARCRVAMNGGTTYRFRHGAQGAECGAQELLDFAACVDGLRTAEDYAGIRRLVAADYFAPAKYVLAAAWSGHGPSGLDIEWESEIPASSGLGSGGAAFTALTAALAALQTPRPALEQRATWAHRGDILAHGGIASALDTQTSLLGRVIVYTGQGLARTVRCAPGLALVVAHTGVQAATAEVNGRVRNWLAERPESRMACFRAIGTLSRAAVAALRTGDWDELGRLMTLNQLVLEKIGIGCPESERLIDAALAAGALGAKISGSGGGGIIIALVTEETRDTISAALKGAGGTVYTPAVAVPGTQVCMGTSR